MPRTLTEDLRRRSDAQLTELLRIRPDLVDPVPANLSRLASHACSTTSVLAALDSLDRPTLQVLGRLATGAGPVCLADLATACGIASWQQLAPVVDILRSRALVWGDEPDHSDARVQAVVAVQEVVRASDVPGPIDLKLRIPVASAAAAAAGAGFDPLANRVSPGADRALTAINAVRWICETWSIESPTVLKSGGVGQRELNLVCDRVGCSADEASFWIALAECAGLLRLDGPPSGFVVSERVTRWLEHDHATQWAELVSAWVRGATPPRAARVKQLMFGWWAQLGPGLAISIDEFAAALADADPRGDQVLLTRRATEALTQAEWLGLTSGGRLNPVAVGLARVASSSPSALAAALSEAVSAGLPVPTSEFVIQADFTVVVAGLPHPVVRAGLTKLGTVESAASATVIRLTERKITQAVVDGWSGPDIEAFLARHSSTAIPQPVAYIIADATARASGSESASGVSKSGAAADRPSVSKPNPGQAKGAGDSASAAVSIEDVAPLDVVLWAVRQADDGVQNGPNVPLAATSSSPNTSPKGGGQPDKMISNPTGRPALPQSPTAQVVAIIRSAMRLGAPLLVGHVDPVGVEGSGIVLALRIGGGSVQVLDQQSRQIRSLVLSRISGVARLPADSWPTLPEFAESGQGSAR